MDRFIHAQNLTHYLDLLETETDPDERERIRGLLIEEEDRFAAGRERERETEMMIARSRARILEQRAVVARLEGDGHDGFLARRILDNMSGLLEILVSVHESRPLPPGPSN